MKDEQQSLTRLEHQKAVGRPAPPSVGEMLQAVIDKGVSSENVAAIEKLVGLYERMQDRDAEKAFAAAFNELQKEIPNIQPTKAVPNNDGTVRYRFAPFEEIDAQLRPLALKFGFSYTFSEAPSEPSKITKICIVQHVAGHKRSNPYTVRIGKGPPGSTESQADGSAHSYAKRGALCDAFSIVVRGQDNDARNEGAPVTKEQAEELERRVKMINGDVAAFLKWAGAKTFATIPETAYEKLDQFLRKKEAKPS